jgi:hypothetical protein
VVVSFPDIAIFGSRLYLLACVVSVAIGMGLEDVGNRLYDRVISVVACMHHAYY